MGEKNPKHRHPLTCKPPALLLEASQKPDAGQLGEEAASGCTAGNLGGLLGAAALLEASAPEGCLPSLPFLVPAS